MENEELLMTVTVSEERCIGCEMCAQTCPEVFRIENGVSIADSSKVTKENVDDVKQAAADCPNEAIEIEE